MNVPESDPSNASFRSLRVLLIIGDWACGLQDAEVLADVARCLAPCLKPPHQRELDEIGRLTRIDVAQASTRWAMLSIHLRAQLAAVLPAAAACRA